MFLKKLGSKSRLKRLLRLCEKSASKSS